MQDEAQMTEIVQKWNEFIETRKTAYNDISELINETRQRSMDVKKSKIAGSVMGIAGSALTITGFALGFFTFGASLGLSVVGASLATAGGVTGSVASLTHYLMNKANFEKAQEVYSRSYDSLCQLLPLLINAPENLKLKEVHFWGKTINLTVGDLRKACEYILINPIDPEGPTLGELSSNALIPENYRLLIPLVKGLLNCQTVILLPKFPALGVTHGLSFGITNQKSTVLLPTIVSKTANATKTVDDAANATNAVNNAANATNAVNNAANATNTVETTTNVTLTTVTTKQTVVSVSTTASTSTKTLMESATPVAKGFAIVGVVVSTITIPLEIYSIVHEGKNLAKGHSNAVCTLSGIMERLKVGL